MATAKNPSKFRNEFYDREGGRCTLCDEKLDVKSFGFHSVSVLHQGRETILEKAIAGKFGLPHEMVDTCWRLLSSSRVTFDRIPELSAPALRQRRCRLRFLLKFLKTVKILRHSLQRDTHRPSGVPPLENGPEFQTLEQHGDSVLKVVVMERLYVLLGEIADSNATATEDLNNLELLPSFLDCNELLMHFYDHLKLDDIVGVSLPHSKSKADVIEAVFGELSSIIYATEQRWGAVTYPLTFASDEYYLRRIAQHTLHELGHHLVFTAFEQALRRGKKVIEKTLTSKKKCAAVAAPSTSFKYVVYPTLQGYPSNSTMVSKAVVSPIVVKPRDFSAAKHAKTVRDSHVVVLRVIANKSIYRDHLRRITEEAPRISRSARGGKSPPYRKHVQFPKHEERYRVAMELQKVFSFPSLDALMTRCVAEISRVEPPTDSMYTLSPALSASPVANTREQFLAEQLVRQLSLPPNQLL
jgi:dsRNA-specific ribonuclease